jgi:hypothetical protein
MKKITLLFALVMSVAIASNAQDTAAQKQYVGKYKFPDGSVVPEVEVVIENGLLMMNSSAGTSSLELLKPDSFSIVNFNGVAVFKRNADKKVIGVHIDAGGYILDGTKDTATGSTHIVRASVPLRSAFQSPAIVYTVYKTGAIKPVAVSLRRREIL